MKKILVLLVGIVIISATSICNASWWYDFIHSDRGDDDYDDTCWHCNGTGRCSNCDGTGVIEGDYNYRTKSYDEETCSDCGGSGNCSACGGSGYN